MKPDNRNPDCDLSNVQHHQLPVCIKTGHQDHHDYLDWWIRTCDRKENLKQMNLDRNKMKKTQFSPLD